MTNLGVLNYHRMLFQWHCRKFFRFRRHLTPNEKDYLETCFRLADDYQETSESGYSHFSYYSYSHRIDGEKVNSSRLAYGSVNRPEEALTAALPVLRERAVLVDDFFLHDPLSKFYGLGWDIEEEQFKVYFRVTQLELLPCGVKALVSATSLQEHRPEGLISFTFVQHKLSETKVYLYPKANENLPEGALGEARMFSDRRGLVSQLDLSRPELWAQKLNPSGQRILALYGELNETLDTIAYQDSEHYTLYFP